MVPAVLAEVLSDPKLLSEVSQILSDLPLRGIRAGYWHRAGALRSKILATRRRERLDFRRFAEAAGLNLIA
jgi:hypothetical protein